jgi:hypothetical protein
VPRISPLSIANNPTTSPDGSGLGMGAGIAQIGGLGANLVGGLFSSLGQSNVDATNAAQARAQAAQAYQLGAWRVGLLRSRLSSVLGAQRAGYAASGVETTSGSPLQAMNAARFMSDLDIQTAHNNAARAAFGYQQQALQLDKQAGAAKGGGIGSLVGGVLGGVGGFVLGGPAGAAAGATLGSGLGGGIGGFIGGGG